MSRGRDWTWLWLLPLTLLTFWLGARGLNADPIWVDEYASMRETGALDERATSPAQIWNEIGERDPVLTPGYFILLSVWGQFVGWTVPALRSLSLFFGVLAVAVTYRLGRDWLYPHAGAIAAMMLGVGAFFVFYLHEMRMYSLTVLLTALALWLYWRILQNERPSWRDWLSLLLGVVGLLYTQYYAALILVAIGAYHLVIAPKRPVRHWWLVVGVTALAGILFLPWLSYLLEALSRHADAPDLQARALGVLPTLGRLLDLFGNGGLTLIAILLILTAWMVARFHEMQQIAFLTVVLLLALLVMNQVLPIMHAGRFRYMIGLWPLLALLIGGSLALALDTWQRFRSVLLIFLGGWFGMAMWANFNADFADWDGTPTRFPTHQVAAAIRDSIRADDLVVNFLGETDSANNFGRGAAEVDYGRLPVDYLLASNRRTTFASGGNVDDNAALDAAWTRGRLWVAALPDDESEALHDFYESLNESYALCRSVVDQPALRLDLYARSPVCCLDESADPLIQFGDAIFLTDWDVRRETDSLAVSLRWTLNADVPPHEYAVSVQLHNADGDNVRQDDAGLAADTLTCQTAEIDLRDLPPGAYDVAVTVYAWRTGERLPGVALDGAATGDLLPLDSVTIPPHDE